MTTSSFTKAKKTPKVIRLSGPLVININGQELTISEDFKLQTDLAFSGMKLDEQETMYKAWQTALAGNAEITFTANLEAEEVKTSAKNINKEPSALDLILAEANKPKPDELLEATVRDDKAKTESTEGALAILGVTSLPETKGIK